MSPEPVSVKDFQDARGCFEIRCARHLVGARGSSRNATRERRRPGDRAARLCHRIQRHEQDHPRNAHRCDPGVPCGEGILCPRPEAWHPAREPMFTRPSGTICATAPRWKFTLFSAVRPPSAYAAKTPPASIPPASAPAFWPLAPRDSDLPMLKLAADENFNNNIVRGLLRRGPRLDLVRIQDVGLSGSTAPELLDGQRAKDAPC